MKKVICDRCGLTDSGRKPSGFTEHISPDGRNYIDLCSDCNNEYIKVSDLATQERNRIIEKWLNGEISKNNTTFSDEIPASVREIWKEN